MKTYLIGDEKGYTLAISKSQRGTVPNLLLEISYSDNERASVSVSVEDLQNALKAFIA